MAEDKSRNKYVDCLRGIAIVLVIIGHLGEETAFVQWIYSFHMPLFFFISGLCMKRTGQFSFALYCKKKAKSYLFPYILLAAIFSNGRYKSLLLILYGNRQALFNAESYTPLWFLPCIFILVLFFKMMLQSRWLNQHKFAWVTTMLSMTLLGGLSTHRIVTVGYPFGIDIALAALPFMFGGYVVRILFERIELTRMIHSIAAMFFFLFSVVAYKQNLPESLTSGFNHVEMAVGIYGNLLLFYICAFGGILFWVSITPLVCNRVLCWIGKNTVECLVIHGPVIAFARSVFDYIGYDKKIVIYPVMVIFTFGIVYIIKKCMSIYD